MKLKNILIVVTDMERSKKFYHDLFGLEVLMDYDGNVILTEGLVLQEKKIWERLIGKEAVSGDGDAELYFEENDMEGFLEKLSAYGEPIRFLNPLMEHDWGRKVVRIYDPDGHVIEIGESMAFVEKRKRPDKDGMIEKLKEFAEPYYAGKDIMHNMWHIELAEKWVNRIVTEGGYEIDRDALTFGLYFHGFIYSDEKAIREWLVANQVPNIETILQIAWESQRSEVPETLEGKILHDAHVLEGGKTYMVVKTLITGSLRNQSLLETLEYLKHNVIDKNQCYLPETKKMCEEMNGWTRQFVTDLEEGILL